MKVTLAILGTILWVAGICFMGSSAHVLFAVPSMIVASCCFVVAFGAN